MTYTDVDRLKVLVPELETVTPLLSRWGRSGTRDEYTAQGSVRGIRPDYSNIETPKLRYGRYINEMDNAGERKVCVLGKKLYKQLFPEGGDPCGESIVIDGVYYQVIGVDYNEGGISIDGSADETYVVPISTFRKTYNTPTRHIHLRQAWDF